MAKYIDKEELLKTVKVLQGNAFGSPLIIKAIENSPVVDVEEVRHGEWMPNELETSQQQYFNGVYQTVIKRLTPINYKCSLCGRVEEYQEPYCNCGAKMDGKDN